MKHTLLGLTLCILLASPLPGLGQVSQSDTLSASATSVPAPTDYTVVERGPHHKIWQRVVYEPTPNGPAPRIHSYTELATGLCYWNNGQWVDSQEIVEPTPGGAIARQGPQTVTFANDLATAGAVTFQKDGVVLRTSILGLSYFDTASGKSTLIAEVQDCQGTIAAPNQVIYTNAFTDISGSVRYTYTKAGFEQDIILEQQPPVPEAYGLNSDSTVLQVLTEVLSPPQPTSTASVFQLSAAAAVPNDDLDFGAFRLARGKAFLLGQSAQEANVSVAKQWLVLDGRQFLVEQVSASALRTQFPAVHQGASLGASSKAVRHMASNTRILPAPRSKAKPGGQMEVASLDLKPDSVVIDYSTMAAAATNYVFQADTTYYISSAVSLRGTNTFEGGTVIKYAVGGSMNFLSGSPSLIWKGSPYRPVVFTASDDAAVGEWINGPSSVPTTTYANPALYLQNLGPQTISNARFCYAKQAILIDGVNLTNYDTQFVRCGIGIGVQADVNSTVFLGNDLFANTVTNLALSSSALSVLAENVTFAGSGWLASCSSGTPTVLLTNCILANVTNLAASVTVKGAYDGLYNAPVFSLTSPLTNPVSPFNPVGAGGFYLTNGCYFLEAATTNVDPTLINDLRARTVYPPLVYSNSSINTTLTLGPQALRQTYSISLGWAYCPLDYAFGGCDVYSNITFQAGTAAGWFRTKSGWQHAGQGIHMDDRRIATFSGTVQAPCYWTRCSTVQEGGTGFWDGGYGAGGITGWADQYAQDVTRSPEVRLQFTRCSQLAGEPGNDFRDDYGYIIVRAIHSEFWGGGYGGYGNIGYFTNCLMDRFGCGNGQGWAGDAWSLQNCTFHGCSVSFTPTQVVPMPVSIYNCAFDGTSININTSTTTDSFDYNAFVTNAAQLPAGDSHAVYVTNFNWQASWLGNYYLPPSSSLIDHGSAGAQTLGLYQFTTQTNQVKEGTTPADIGYHYVAVDGNGTPDDFDGDGIPDYVEDTNGDGIFDSGDLSDWKTYNSPNGLTSGNGLVVFTPLK